MLFPTDLRSRRRGRLCAAGAVGLVLAGTLVAPALTSAAHASYSSTARTETWYYAFDTPGTYHLTVPSGASGDSNVYVVGAGGGTGDSAAGNPGASGGFPALLNPIGTTGTAWSDLFYPGEQLTIVVGRRGAGGNRGDGAGGGYGDGLGGRGGAGGGASWIQRPDGSVIILAGGGGGGGGAGGVLPGTAGVGGADPLTLATGGLPGNNVNGSEGNGGTGGEYRTCGSDNVPGVIAGPTAGGNAALGSAAGGGGGGGGGACGGSGGGAGRVGGGGGGGGAGGSIYQTWWNWATVAAWNDFSTSTGDDGAVHLSFNVHLYSPTFTSTDMLTVGSSQTSATYQVTTNNDPDLPAPRYSLLDAPSWARIDPNTGLITFDGFRAAGAAGSWSFHVLAQTGRNGNTDYVTDEGFTVLIDTAPQYPWTIRDLGTVVTGQTASYQYALASYPAPAYGLVPLGGAVPSWVTVDPQTGQLMVAPPDGAAGTYEFYVSADNGVDPVTYLASTLTVTQQQAGDPTPTDPTTAPTPTPTDPTTAPTPVRTTPVTHPAPVTHPVSHPMKHPHTPRTFHKLTASRVKGKGKVGHRLTVRHSRVAPAARTISYRWLRGGKRIHGATKAHYRVHAADRGHRLVVEIIYRAPGVHTRVIKVLVARHVR